jgi:hypothetical protein
MILVTLSATSPEFASANMALILPVERGRNSDPALFARSRLKWALIGAIRNPNMKSLDLLAAGGKAYSKLLKS